MKRRGFLAAPMVAGAMAAAPVLEADTRVVAVGDGIPHTPAEYAAFAREAE